MSEPLFRPISPRHFEILRSEEEEEEEEQEEEEELELAQQSAPGSWRQSSVELLPDGYTQDDTLSGDTQSGPLPSGYHQPSDFPGGVIEREVSREPFTSTPTQGEEEERKNEPMHDPVHTLHTLPSARTISHGLPSSTQPFLRGGGPSSQKRTQISPSRPPQQSASSEPFRDWNQDFLQAQQDVESGQWERMAQVARDFVYCSKTYGKIIISELHLPDHQKTVPPCPSLGGLAGGKKYRTHGIVFKFALDQQPEGYTSYVYGGLNGPDDDAAMKAARNEMVGLLSYYNCGVPELHLPLMAQLDYRGYRLVALSQLPVAGKATLCYGSMDRCKTLQCDADIAPLMKKAGHALNLKGHQCVGHPHTIYAPCDIEGHRGTDGNFYLLDFSRAMPPEDFDVRRKNVSKRIFFCVLRPEFMRTYIAPLSSDAFSTFEETAIREENKREIRAATRYLFATHIPRFVATVASLSPDALNTLRLTEILHRAGLNCRHLGRVRHYVQEQEAAALLYEEKGPQVAPAPAVYLEHPEALLRLLLSEMLARLLSSIIRHLLRETMEQTQEAREAPYRNLVHEVMSAIMTHPIPVLPGAPTFTAEELATQNEEALSSRGSLALLQDPHAWQGTLKAMLQVKFEELALSPDERASWQDLRTLADMPRVVDRLCTQCGIKISRAARQAHAQDPHSFRLLRFDVRKISVRVRHMNVVDEAEANLLLQEAHTQGAVRPGLWEAVGARLARAVGSHTTSDRLLLRWGHMLLDQCASLPLGAMESHQERVRRSLELLDQAYEKFQRAEAIDENNPEMRWGKGQVQVLRAAVFMAWATSDTLAYQQWSLQVAVVEFRALFEAHAHLFPWVEETSSSLYEQATHATDACKKAFLFLRVHLLLHCCLQVAPSLPSSALFFRAGTAAIEYLHCEVPRLPYAHSVPSTAVLTGGGGLRHSHTGAFDRTRESHSAGSRLPAYGAASGRGKRVRNHSELRGASSLPGLAGDFLTHAVQSYLMAASGFLLEAALMQVGCLSDGQFLYSFADECRLQSSKLASRFQTDREVPIDIRQAHDTQHEVQLTKAQASTTRLLLMPLIYQSPENNLQAAHNKNKLISALVLGDVESETTWPVPRDFTLALPHYHAFVINRIALRVSGAPSVQVHLQASTTERISFPRPTRTSLQAISTPRIAVGGAKESGEAREDEREDEAGLGTSFPLGECTLQSGQTWRIDLTDPRPIRYVGVRLHATGTGRATPLQLHGLQFWGMFVDQPLDKAHVLRPIRLPIKPRGEYRPRPVEWICESRAYKIELADESHTFTLAASHSSRRVVSDTCTVRASPAWALHEDPEAPSLRSDESLHPVLLYVDASEPPHEAQEAALEVARDLYARTHHTSQLTIERHTSLDSVKAWVMACDPGRLGALLARGHLRLLVGHLPALKRKVDHVSSLLLEWEEALLIDPNRILVLFAPDARRHRALHQGMMWWAETDQHVVEFAAMRWSSLTLHFDPCGLFQQEKTLHRSKRRIHSLLASPFVHVRSHRTSSHSLEEAEAQGPRTAFIYHEVTLPREELPEWAMGVTPHHFDVHLQLPGQVVGSYAWHSSGQLLCNGHWAAWEGGQAVRAQPGDVLGCGYNFETKAIFWTHNGQYLGTAEARQAVVSESIIEYLFPALGFRGLPPARPLRVEGNFGQAPFLFPYHLLEDAVQTEKFARRASQQDIPQLLAAFLAPCGQNQRVDLLLLAQIAQYSFAFQSLFKAHLSHRQSLSPPRRQYHTLHLAQCPLMRDHHLAGVAQLFTRLVHVDLSHSLRLSSRFLTRMPDVFQRIQTLTLGDMELEDQTAQDLVARCPRLEGLRPWPNLTNEALLVLATLPALRDLELVCCAQLTDAGLKAFLGRPLSLRALTLYECEALGRGTIKALSKSTVTRKLQKLRLECCPRLFENDPRGNRFKRLFHAASELVAVSFAGCSDHPSPVTPDQVAALCQRLGSQLRALSLYFCHRLSEESLQCVASHCSLLEELNVGNLSPRTLTPAVWPQLAGISQQLQRLELVDTPLDDDNLLLFSQQQPHLRQLSLQRCSITWTGVMQALPFWVQLSFLSLKETHVSTDQLYYRMADPEVLPSLRVLDLRRTQEPPGFNLVDSQYAFQLLKDARPHWLILPRDATEINCPPLCFVHEHVNEGTLRFPPTKISSIRLRKNRG